MHESKLSFLTWLAIANTTISSRNFLSVSNTNAMLLSRQMFSTFHFDKLKFTKITNIISYQNLLFSRCYTDRLSFFKVKSYAPLKIDSSTFREGKIEVIKQNVNVRRSKFYLSSNNFFKVVNSEVASYEFADFSSISTSKPALMFNKVQQINLKICNFTNIAAGAVKISKTKATNIFFGIFNKCQSEYGGAIYSDSNEFSSEKSFFIDCSATKSGGSIYFTRNCQNSQLTTTTFIENKSPSGDSIVNEGQLKLIDCIFTGDLKTEIIGTYQKYDVKSSHNRLSFTVDSTPTDTPTPPYATAIRPPGNSATNKGPPEITDEVYITILVAVVCVLIVVVIGFVIYFRMKKQRNTIYATDKEIKDENEMGTVEIKSKYLLSKVYSNDNNI